MVEDLIRRAQRRFVFNEALGQAAFAGSFALGGLALILILGTRFLEWWTLGLFAAAGIAAGAIRLYRSTPDVYATAVRVDRNAHLNDVLSTAVYFTTHTAAYSGFQGAQREQAEAASRAVDLDVAVPFAWPRSLYAVAGLALLASALMGLRFFGTHGLDLRPPLTEVLFEDQAAKLIGRKGAAGDPAARQRLETAESLLTRLGMAPKPDNEQKADGLDQAIDRALEGPGRAGEKDQKGKAEGQSGKDAQGDNQAAGDPLDGKQGEGGEPKDQDKNGAGQKSSSEANGKDSKNGDNSSLMSKLKDAMQNMFSKAGEKNSGENKKGGQQGQASKADKTPGEKGTQANKGKPEDQDQDQDQGDSQESEPNNSDDSQTPSKPGAKSTQSVAQAGSGAGNQNGDKDTKAAEQLKAMGKISEIIGKRAESVSGETSIEVQSGNQQLRTAYSKSNAAHGEADSDVSRDEIPVALQPYIKEYFEQVRKSTAEPKAKAATP